MPDPGQGALPRVVLVGRPNAGKSTLFNRLVRRRKALVDPSPGVTRDTNEGVARLGGRPVVLVDTGGFEAEGSTGLDRAVGERALAAVTEADVVVYILDGKAGLSPADEAAARTLRRRRARVLFAVNKLDSPARERAAAEFYRLGSDLLPISAEHGHGVGALVEAIHAHLPTEGAQTDGVPTPESAIDPERTTARATRVSVIGRPNVGKSSLVNRLLGYARALVDAEAGTTRDAVDTSLEVDGMRFVLVDTAGVRRRARIHERLERAAAGKALEAIARSDVVVVIDASEGPAHQDLRLAAHAWEEGRGLVIVANKWDLRQDDPDRFAADLRGRFPQLATVPILTVSALTGAGVPAIVPAVVRVAEVHDVALRTARLNQVVMDAVRAKDPPLVGGRRPRIFYATQVGRRPPTVAIFTSTPSSLHPSYHRYLQKRIAEAFALSGTPVRVEFRARH